jgi:membrane protease subunit (stomatin/prohibitin family)
MGLFDKLRAELIDIVEWIDDTNHTLVWRFPRYQNEIKNGAKLVVRPGQVAIFVNEGEIADLFDPGTYELTTKNLPILTTLRGWKYGFNSPFKAEVYFVSTRQITDLKWGTPQPIMLRDADFGPMQLRAFGSYALRVIEPKALLRELVGTDGHFEADEVGELLRSLLTSGFASLLGESKIAALDLAGNYRSLGEELRKRVRTQIDDEYGLDLPLVTIHNISLPPEVQKMLDTRTSMGIIGDMGRFQQYQLGNAMLAAAQNPAGPGPGATIGLGMTMAHQMMNPGMVPGFAPGAAPVAAGGAPPSLPPPLPAFHVNLGGQSAGPFDAAAMSQHAARGQVRPDTLVWTQGMAAWAPAGQVPQLAYLFASAGPPPLPPPLPAG